MTLRQYIEATGGINWTSPNSPVGQDYFELYISGDPIPHDHPPSLKKPIITKIPLAQQGYRKGDSAALRERAKSDLIELHKRARRQIGKPEVSYAVQMPSFPDIQTWL